MNRILELNGKFQVLVTPTYVDSPSFELMLGNWEDKNLRGFHIREFDTLQDAIDLAFKYPSIDWNKIVSLHKDAYHIIVNSIKNNLRDGKFIIELDSKLMSPIEIKETMFRRVYFHGERYNLFYNANDVICINIINPWTKNLIEIANLLKNIPELRIVNLYKTKTHLCLVGVTDVGTTYEIRLWTTLMAHWTRWILINNLNPNHYIKLLNQKIEEQYRIDNGDAIR